jgi:hypothetical protein
MMLTHRPRRGLVAPLPLLVLFGLFLAAIVYLVAASLTRGNAPVFPASPLDRKRAAQWAVDTITVDATDGDRWQYLSLTRGRVLVVPDTAGWELAVQRYRVITPRTGAVADIGPVPFAAANPSRPLRFVPTVIHDQPENAAIEHWYRYNLLTHLLEPNGHVFVIRTPAGAQWKVGVLSYYCPKLVAGCLTLRYAPLNRSI